MDPISVTCLTIAFIFQPLCVPFTGLTIAWFLLCWGAFGVAPLSLAGSFAGYWVFALVLLKVNPRWALGGLDMWGVAA